MVEKPPARRRSSIVRALSGKRVFITGFTGFLGQAAAERLLLDFPHTQLVLLVRPQHGSSGRERVESILARPAFNVLREKLGYDGLLGLVGERVEVVEGDFSPGRPPGRAAAPGAVVGGGVGSGGGGGGGRRGRLPGGGAARAAGGPGRRDALRRDRLVRPAD